MGVKSMLFSVAMAATSISRAHASRHAFWSPVIPFGSRLGRRQGKIFSDCYGQHQKTAKNQTSKAPK
jgi:hypothetical protein